MTKEELAFRIEKITTKIEKINKRIKKWTTGMSDEAKVIAAACETMWGNPDYNKAWDNERAFSKEHENDPSVFNPDDWNKGPQLGEAARAYGDLAEAKNTLRKYEVQLEKLNNFDNAEKIEVIWSFLQAWKQEVKDFIIDSCSKLGVLKSNYQKEFEKFTNTEEYKDRLAERKKVEPEWRAKWALEKEFEKMYYDEIPSLAYKFHTRNGNYDEKALEKFLDAEVRSKYNDLVNRITEKAGQIVDASGLYIGQKGQINGIVNGLRGTVRVETIPAEGPIQRFHYRTLVKPLKQYC